jgi:hypothetical protein
VRVSTIAQTLDQQNAALAAVGVRKTFCDNMSGARDDRPGLAALMDYVREGDTIVVWKLDRLGRNTLHILETVKAFDPPWRQIDLHQRWHRLFNRSWPHDDWGVGISRRVRARAGKGAHCPQAADISR